MNPTIKAGISLGLAVILMSSVMTVFAANEAFAGLRNISSVKLYTIATIYYTDGTFYSERESTRLQYLKLDFLSHTSKPIQSIEIAYELWDESEKFGKVVSASNFSPSVRVDRTKLDVTGRGDHTLIERAEGEVTKTRIYAVKLSAQEIVNIALANKGATDNDNIHNLYAKPVGSIVALYSGVERSISFKNVDWLHVYLYDDGNSRIVNSDITTTPISDNPDNTDGIVEDGNGNIIAVPPLDDESDAVICATGCEEEGIMQGIATTEQNLIVLGAAGAIIGLAVLWLNKSRRKM